MIIPKGKVVTITENGKDIMPAGIRLTLDTQVTLSLQSHFESLLGNTEASTLATVITGGIHDITGGTISASFKETGYQIWKGTDPLTFAFSTTLNMKSSAYKDVFLPAKTLMKLVLPSEPNGIGFGLLAPGPTILSALNKKTDYTKKFSFRCGVIYLPNIIVTKAEPTFSDDIDSAGYPIWCTLQMELSSVFTATTNLIDGFNANY